MTGTELLRVRTALGLSQASVASMLGGQSGSQAATVIFTVADINGAEASAATISNGNLNTQCEAVFRKSLGSNVP